MCRIRFNGHVEQFSYHCLPASNTGFFLSGITLCTLAMVLQERLDGERETPVQLDSHCSPVRVCSEISPGEYRDTCSGVKCV